MFLLYHLGSNDPFLKTQAGFWLLPIMGDRKPVSFLTAPFWVGQGQVAPDGKWIAYTSDESGRREVYVRNFSEGGFKAQVSSQGGEFARWRKNGKELFYVAPDRKLMSVNVRAASASLELSTPNALFKLPPATATGLYSYDVMPDGQRLLVLAPAAESEAPPMTVVLNWQAELPAAEK